MIFASKKLPPSQMRLATKPNGPPPPPSPLAVSFRGKKGTGKDMNTSWVINVVSIPQLFDRHGTVTLHPLDPKANGKTGGGQEAYSLTVFTSEMGGWPSRVQALGKVGFQHRQQNFLQSDFRLL